MLWYVSPRHYMVQIVDELSNKEECNAARTITGRGVAVVATVRERPTPSDYPFLNKT